MKKKKLNLNELKVKSFLTTLNNNSTSKVKGGVTGGPLCEETAIGTPCIGSARTCPDGHEDYTGRYGLQCDGGDGGDNTAGLCQTDGDQGLCTN